MPVGDVLREAGVDRKTVPDVVVEDAIEFHVPAKLEGVVDIPHAIHLAVIDVVSSQPIDRLGANLPRLAIKDIQKASIAQQPETAITGELEVDQRTDSSRVVVRALIRKVKSPKAIKFRWNTKFHRVKFNWTLKGVKLPK